ncbi:MAG: hypothetical protein KC619_12090 [Myxococcales bacterium]|nr:hypothetical protein [Myxococcales bacterium]
MPRLTRPLGAFLLVCHSIAGCASGGYEAGETPLLLGPDDQGPTQDAVVRLPGSCTGVLISRRLVLTAGRCVPSNEGELWDPRDAFGRDSDLCVVSEGGSIWCVPTEQYPLERPVEAVARPAPPSGTRQLTAAAGTWWAATGRRLYRLRASDSRWVSVGNLPKTTLLVAASEAHLYFLDPDGPLYRSDASAPTAVVRVGSAPAGATALAVDRVERLDGAADEHLFAAFPTHLAVWEGEGTWRPVGSSDPGDRIEELAADEGHLFACVSASVGHRLLTRLAVPYEETWAHAGQGTSGCAGLAADGRRVLSVGADGRLVSRARFAEYERQSFDAPTDTVAMAYADGTHLAVDEGGTLWRRGPSGPWTSVVAAPGVVSLTADGATLYGLQRTGGSARVVRKTAAGSDPFVVFDERAELLALRPTGIAYDPVEATLGVLASDGSVHRRRPTVGAVWEESPGAPATGRVLGATTREGLISVEEDGSLRSHDSVWSGPWRPSSEHALRFQPTFLKVSIGPRWGVATTYDARYVVRAPTSDLAVLVLESRVPASRAVPVRLGAIGPGYGVVRSWGPVNPLERAGRLRRIALDGSGGWTEVAELPDAEDIDVTPSGTLVWLSTEGRVFTAPLADPSAAVPHGVDATLVALASADDSTLFAASANALHRFDFAADRFVVAAGDGVAAALAPGERLVGLAHDEGRLVASTSHGRLLARPVAGGAWSEVGLLRRSHLAAAGGWIYGVSDGQGAIVRWRADGTHETVTEDRAGVFGIAVHAGHLYGVSPRHASERQRGEGELVAGWDDGVGARADLLSVDDYSERTTLYREDRGAPVFLVDATFGFGELVGVVHSANGHAAYGTRTDSTGAQTPFGLAVPNLRDWLEHQRALLP